MDPPPTNTLAILKSNAKQDSIVSIKNYGQATETNLLAPVANMIAQGSKNNSPKMSFISNSSMVSRSEDSSKPMMDPLIKEAVI